MCLEMCFCRRLRCSKRGVETGNDRLFPVGELIPRPKTMKGMNEPMRARDLHTMVSNTWMNANTEQEFYTAPESQFCQALCGNKGMTAGQNLLESEQIECRGAGVVQTTSWVLMTVVASMATMASMAPMAPMASMASSIEICDRKVSVQSSDSPATFQFNAFRDTGSVTAHDRPEFFPFHRPLPL